MSATSTRQQQQQHHHHHHAALWALGSTSVSASLLELHERVLHYEILDAQQGQDVRPNPVVPHNDWIHLPQRNQAEPLHRRERLLKTLEEALKILDDN